MSVNLASKTRRQISSIATAIGEPSWILFVFFFSIGFIAAPVINVLPVLKDFSETTLGQLSVGAAIYALVLVLVIVPALLIRGKGYVKHILGVDKKPLRSTWWLPFAMWVLYMLATLVAGILVTQAPWFDIDQEQEVGFAGISLPVEYVIAFFALVIIPPIAEELLFRGYLFGRLRERLGFVMTALIVSLAFGLVHQQWNVGIDTFILSLFLCYLREKTGSVWASMVLHAIKNGVAYFFLFIAPLLGWQLIQ